MRADTCAAERADIVGWSTPLIADCLDLAYRTCFGQNSQLVDHFTQQHRRLWLSVVANNPKKAAEACQTLATLAKMCRLTEEAIEAIDDIVMDELTEVVSRRFQGSPMKTSAYSRILIDAAAVLTQTRLSVAA